MSDLHSIEAEQALLGALLVNNDVIRQCPATEPAHFFEPLHGRVFELIRSKINAGALASPVTLRFALQDDRALADLGGPAYLARMAGAAITLSAAWDYAALIRDMWARRQMAAAVGKAAARLESGDGGGIEEIAAELSGAVAEVVEAGGAKPLSRSWLRAVTEAVQETADAYQNDRPPGVSWGLRSLDDAVGTLMPGRLYVMAGRPSMGKAQPLDAPILMADGCWKAMGDLRVGDRLASTDGAPSRVSGVFPQGERQIFRVRFSDGRSAECCGDHLWRVHYRAWDEPRVLSTARVATMLTRARYAGRLWIDAPSGHFGHTEDLPIDPWLLGLLLGDGCFRDTVRLSTVDQEIIDLALTAAGDGFRLTARGHNTFSFAGVTPRWQKGRAGPRPNELKEALVGLGLWGCDSATKFVPPIYLSAAREARLQVLRGLMDADGWVEKHGSVRFCTISPHLARDVQMLVRSVGGVCSINKKPTRYTYKGKGRHPGQPAFTCNIQHPEPWLLFRLSRKRAATQAPRRLRKPVFASIEPMGPAEAQCISVTHASRLYVTNDYVVTHNTAVAETIAIKVAQAGTPVAFASLEMLDTDLARRGLSQMLRASGMRTPYFKLERGQVTDGEMRRTIEVAQEHSALPLHFIGRDHCELSRLGLACRALRRSKEIGLIVVDYLQLVQVDGARSTFDRVSAASKGLKRLAMDLKVPVIALCQLSRAVEERDDKRPRLSDLRASGEIEEDADVVMGLYRDGYYCDREKPGAGLSKALGEWHERAARAQNRLDVLALKVRGGAVGTVSLRCELEHNWVEDWPAQEALGF